METERKTMSEEKFAEADDPADFGEQNVSRSVPEVEPLAAGEAAEPRTGGEEKDLEEQLQNAQSEARENYDRFLRAVAELDNYRKRVARIRIETREETLRDLLLQIAPVLDNLNRALAHEGGEVESLKRGMELIVNQFKETLRGYGLEEIQAVGQLFDPNLHEALMEVATGDCPPGTVVGEMEKGYTLNKKIVRPARVIVSKVGGEEG
jgi:molecular chaperone GrpE